jgi:hypothetical protein
VLAVVALGAMAVPKTKTGRKGRIDQAVKGVAAFSAKPRVCRGSYIDPRVFDRYRGGAKGSPPPCVEPGRSTRCICHRRSRGSSAR